MKHDGSKPRRHWFQFSIKAVMILTLAVAAYFAGKVPEQRRAIDAELRARNEAERAMMAEQEARMTAEESMRQAQIALQQAKNAEARLAAERISTSEAQE